MLRWIVRLLLVLVVVLGAAGVWVVSGAARGPNVTGSLAFAGLKDRVDVLARRQWHSLCVRAEHAGPDTRARLCHGASRASFQLTAYRALATGRLAEAIGERGLAERS
jgi:hypothetical protein